ncbi:DUF1853 family protein [Alloalcanivorax venustensis]|uniref:DUF1853 family protein n=2 Tax=Alloalcanivorax venustensis TaxID=172371 RepID=UPI00329882DC
MSDPATLAGELEWLTQAPPLITPPPGCDSADAALRYCAGEPGVLRRAAGTLAEQPRPRRLGQHFENLVAAVLQHSQRYRLVARNVPLRLNGKTLGELDMLVEDRDTGELMHWELALKFYLGLPGGPEERAWPGPNPRDQLVTKIRHLHDRQLTRCDDPVVAALLAEQGWRVGRKVLLTRGRLFHTESGTALPEETNPSHQQGTWLYARTLETAGAVIPHDHWHCPRTLSDNRTDFVAAEVLRDYVQTLSSPVMIRTESGSITFAAPDSWPDH